MIGSHLGHYRIVDQITAGGMAVIYRAYDATMDRYVALKVLSTHYSQHPQFLERFRREAKVLARLEHPHILPVYGFGEEDGTAYLVMRYLPTGTLADVLQKGRMSLAKTSHFLSQMASALDHAHSFGIVHRDIKPSNVLVDQHGNAYLMDFGIAKILEVTVDLTQDRILGTPGYMSPEQCLGQKDLTPASDIYSLGVVLYEMVTGCQPYTAETPLAVINQHLHGRLTLPQKHRPDLPEPAERVILKAMARDPSSRHESAVAMARAFDSAIQPKSAGDREATVVQESAFPPTEVAPAPKRVTTPGTVRRIPRGVWPLLGVTAAIIILIAFSLNSKSGTEELQPTLTPDPMIAVVDLSSPSPQPTATIRTESTVSLEIVPSETPRPTHTPTPQYSPGEVMFRDSGQRLGNGASDYVALADVDNDLDLDAFVAACPNVLWLNDGQGGFSDSGENTGCSRAVDLGDVDNDGDLDLIKSEIDGVYVWRNSGRGRFWDTGQLIASDAEHRRDVELGDLDADGSLDIFVALAHPNAPSEVWMNDGSGWFSDSGQRLGDSNSISVKLGDLDGDGDLDAYVGTDARTDGSDRPEQDLIWLNDGQGRFDASGQVRYGNVRTMDLSLGDVDGDGDLDILVASCCDLGNRIWINDGTSVLTSSALDPDDPDAGASSVLNRSNAYAGLLGDLDGDHDLDAIIVNHGSPHPENAALFLNRGDGRFRLWNTPMVGPFQAHYAALGDLDGDGDLDLFVASRAGADVVWFNEKE
jgi:serine/threonine protein kinase